MEQVLANISGKVRRAQLYGREHIVAPLSMVVEGVLNGSKGPLYYPLDEISKEPSIWNHMPIVDYHPTRNGKHVSARRADVLNEKYIGVVLEAKVIGNKLVAEGWFDVEHTKRVDSRILQALEAGQPIELSTGLYTDNKPAHNGANHRGKPYAEVARNYRPDHLAILPDQKGACSIPDGCGVNNEEDVENYDPDQSRAEDGKWDGGGGGSRGGKGTEDRHEVAGYRNDAHHHEVSRDQHLSRAKTQRAIAEKQKDPKQREWFMKIAEHHEAQAKLHDESAKHIKAGTHNEADEEKSTLWQKLGSLLGITGNIDDEDTTDNGGAGSGNFGHSGRPGEIGGSGGEGGSTDKGASNSTAKAKVASLGAEGKEGHEHAAKVHKEAMERHQHAQSQALKEWGKAQHRGASQDELNSIQDKIFQHASAAKEHKEAAISHASIARVLAHNQASDSNSDGQLDPSITNEGGENMAKLTEADRKKLVDNLCTNCDCVAANTWAEEDRETLNKFSDERLKVLAENKQKLVDHEAVVNAVKEGFGQELTVNEMPAALKAAMDKKKGKKEADPEEPDEDDKDMEKNAAKLTDEQLEDLEFARNEKNRQKAEIVGNLVANVADEQKKSLTALLQAKPLKELQALALLAPKAEQTTNQHQPRYARTPSYAGAGGAPVLNRRVTANRTEDEQLAINQSTIDIMVPKGMDYAAISQETSGRKQLQKS